MLRSPDAFISKEGESGNTPRALLLLRSSHLARSTNSTRSSIGTSGAEGSVQLGVDNVNKAKKALQGPRLSCSEQDVLQVELPHPPGALASFAGTLVAKEIIITSGYQTAAKGPKKSSVVLAVSDLEKAARVR